MTEAWLVIFKFPEAASSVFCSLLWIGTFTGFSARSWQKFHMSLSTPLPCFMEICSIEWSPGKLVCDFHRRCSWIIHLAVFSKSKPLMKSKGIFPVWAPPSTRSDPGYATPRPGAECRPSACLNLEHKAKGFTLNVLLHLSEQGFIDIGLYYWMFSSAQSAQRVFFVCSTA